MDHQIYKNGATIQNNNKNVSGMPNQPETRGYGGFPHLYQGQTHRETYNNSPNQEHFQNYSSPRNNLKTAKTSGTRQNCPAILSTSTLPRSGLALQGQEQNSCGGFSRQNSCSTDSRPDPVNGGITSHCQQSSGAPHQQHYGTLGRIRTRSEDPGLKIKKDLRASASDLTERRGSASNRSKQESVV